VWQGPRGLIFEIPRNLRTNSRASVYRRALSRSLALAGPLFLLSVVSLAASRKNQPPSSKETAAAVPRGALELVFPYGSNSIIHSCCCLVFRASAIVTTP
jgi:hypothetical protein